MPTPRDRWLDEAAGPVVRPYALIRGRTRPSGESLDLIAIVTAVRGVRGDPVELDPEHFAVLRLCRLPTSVAELAALGVRRISVGSALNRAALGAFVRAAREIGEHGTFAFAEDAIPYAQVNDLMLGP